MQLLKNLPIEYKGELRGVVLVNFSVDYDELQALIPRGLPLRNIGGRAWVSLVNVSLRSMRPVFAPAVRFHYRHIAFRVLLEDSLWTGQPSKGIFFYRSFTDKPLVVLGGKLMTNYNLETARIESAANELALVKGAQFLHYKLGNPGGENPAAQNIVGALDRAYAPHGDEVRVTQIQREKWPLQAVTVENFETNFFASARVEAAFRVPETIHYTWLPPKPLHKCAS